ncbi:MAG: hypothetical protein QG635_354, partial [Bacteroidota bacterium]|nr:hypothetical protein [Bacteroidota bacterium]
MIWTIAWRNLWRNKRRSIIILISVIIGVAALMLNDSLNSGFITQMISNQVNSHTSDIQIHRKGYSDNKIIQNFMPEPARAEQSAAKCPLVKYYSRRTLVFGLLSSAASSAGTTIVGIEPEKEKNITFIKKSIVKGRYLTGKPNEIVIGGKMAEKLEVGLGDKVVTVASSVNGEVTNELFRVVGIFKTGSSEFDKSYIYIPFEQSQKMLGLGSSYTEIAIITNSDKDVDEAKRQIAAEIGSGFETLTYKELMPLMMSYIEMYKQMIVVFYVIFGCAVLFGIINTMLMAVFERVHEFGVLMSIGMKNGKIFIMVIAEALLLGIFGTFIGVIVGFAVYYPLAVNGLDLSIYAESLESFGVGKIVYPDMNFDIIFNSVIIMPIVTAIGAIYPARKA